jgi:hypothetical protein
MIPGAARTNGYEKHMGFAAQYLWFNKSGFSPGRNLSPTRTGGGMNNYEGLLLSQLFTKSNAHQS